jgi:hypothetical protein
MSTAMPAGRLPVRNSSGRADGFNAGMPVSSMFVLEARPAIMGRAQGVALGRVV